MTHSLDSIKITAIPILKQAGVTRSALFGSYAQGLMHEESDIDLLVELPGAVSLLGVARLKNQLQQALGKTVDLVEYSAIQPKLQKYILSNHIPLYES